MTTDKIKKQSITIIVICVAIVAIATALFFVWGNSLNFNRDMTTDPGKYTEYLGQNGKYIEQFGGGKEIFPARIPATSTHSEFYFEYYEPQKANYFGYLVYECSQTEYEEEKARLKSLASTEEPTVYGIGDFRFDVAAIYATDTNVVYALLYENTHRIIYVGLSFTEYFTDIAYKNVVNSLYLPDGFDATPNNPYYKEKNNIE